MSEMEKLAGMLRQEQEKEKNGAEALERTLTIWQTALHDLATKVAGWASTLQEQGIAQYKLTVIDVLDTFPDGEKRSYKADQISISLGKHTVVFKPSTRFIVGAAGRVEVLGLPSKDEVFLIRNAADLDEWSLVEKNSGKRQVRNFDEDVFAILLQSLIK